MKKAIIGILALFIVFFTFKKTSPPKLDVILPLVTVTQAGQGSLPISVEIPAVAESVQTVKIFPRVEGELLKIHFQEGQIVQQGQVLFSLDHDLYTQQLRALQGQLTSHQARLDYYNKEQIRFKRLSGKDYASQEQYDQSVMNSLTEAAAIEEVNAQIKQMELNISYSSICSPVTGIIGFVNAYEGTYIKTTDSMPLTTVVKMDPLRFSLFLPEKYLKFIQNGQTTYCVKDHMGTVIADSTVRHARLDATDNAIDASLGNINLKIAIDNSDGLFMPGMYVTVQSIFTQQFGLKIPVTCLQKGQKGDYVYKYDPETQHVSMTPVTVAVLDDQWMIVTHGLQEEDKIVVQGQIKLRDGCRVRVQPFTK